MSFREISKALFPEIRCVMKRFSFLYFRNQTQHRDQQMEQREYFVVSNGYNISQQGTPVFIVCNIQYLLGYEATSS
jgi:hypothetical protein